MYKAAATAIDDKDLLQLSQRFGGGRVSPSSPSLDFHRLDNRVVSEHHDVLARVT